MQKTTLQETALGSARAAGAPGPDRGAAAPGVQDRSLKRLAALARRVQARAHAPYSGFRVGAALESESGEVFTGCNVENASFGLTICAERSALVQAVAQGHRRFRRIVIVTDSDRAVAPCGACRQVIAEFGRSTEVVSLGRRGSARWLLGDLIPECFNLNEAAAAGGAE